MQWMPIAIPRWAVWASTQPCVSLQDHQAMVHRWRLLDDIQDTWECLLPCKRHVMLAPLSRTGTCNHWKMLHRAGLFRTIDWRACESPQTATPLEPYQEEQSSCYFISRLKRKQTSFSRVTKCIRERPTLKIVYLPNGWLVFKKESLLCIAMICSLIKSVHLLIVWIR